MAKKIVISLFLLVAVVFGPRFEKQREFRVILHETNFDSHVKATNSNRSQIFNLRVELKSDIKSFKPDIRIMSASSQEAGGQTINILENTRITQPTASTLEVARAKSMLGDFDALKTVIGIELPLVDNNGISEYTIVGEMCNENECTPFAERFQIESYLKTRYYTNIGDFLAAIMSV